MKADFLSEDFLYYWWYIPISGFVVVEMNDIDLAIEI